MTYILLSNAFKLRQTFLAQKRTIGICGNDHFIVGFGLQNINEGQAPFLN